MTTTLTQPSAICFFGPAQFILQHPNQPEPRVITLQNYPVADAVAASSAFPLLFPPMQISAEECAIYNEQFGIPPQHLTDGGVFENLGVTVLRSHLAMLAPEHGPDSCQLIVSNAGARLDWDLSTPFAEKRFRSILRSVEIIQYWAEQRLYATRAPNEIVVDISDTCDEEGFPSASFQQQGARFRTDLDYFSNLEWHMLYDHGYATARKLLRPLVSSAHTHSAHAHSPWQGVAVTAPRERALIRGPLARARRRRWRPWIGRDAYSLLYVVLLCVCLIAILAVWNACRPRLAFGTDVKRSTDVLVQPAPSRGVQVTSVIPGSPGDEAGLKEGDIVFAVDNTLVAGIADFLTLSRGKPQFAVSFWDSQESIVKRIEIKKTSKYLKEDTIGVNMLSLPTED